MTSAVFSDVDILQLMYKTVLSISPLQTRLVRHPGPPRKNACGGPVGVDVLRIGMNLIKWFMNLIKFGHACVISGVTTNTLLLHF